MEGEKPLKIKAISPYYNLIIVFRQWYYHFLVVVVVGSVAHVITLVGSILSLQQIADCVNFGFAVLDVCVLLWWWILLC